MHSTAEIPRALRELLQQEKTINYAEFINHALYHESEGYYMKDKARVGYEESSDFYTARSFKNIFKNLIENSASTLIQDIEHYTLTEIGVEPEESLYENGEEHPFNHYKAIQVSTNERGLQGGNIILTNELLDAQPFHRLRFIEGEWKEIGIQIKDTLLEEAQLPCFSVDLKSANLKLPKDAQEGYTIDISIASERLFESILSQDWHGLFLFFDYGKDWHEITTQMPQGSGRAYFQHQCSQDILANPGDQDITSHVCWDRLEAIAQKYCKKLKLQTQGDFFMHHAPDTIAKIIEASDSFSQDKQTLKELIMPHHMGRKFQVLWGIK